MKINKILTVITAVTFAAALTLNIQASLSDPFAGMSDEALAQTTSEGETTGGDICQTEYFEEIIGTCPECDEPVYNAWKNCDWSGKTGSCEDGLHQSCMCGTTSSVVCINCDTGEQI